MNGVWSEFAEEEMYNNIPYEDMPTRKLKAILRELHFTSYRKAKHTYSCARFCWFGRSLGCT